MVIKKKWKLKIRQIQKKVEKEEDRNETWCIKVYAYPLRVLLYSLTGIFLGIVYLAATCKWECQVEILLILKL